ncbi:MAG: hypothetical protein AAGA35_02035 [Patescibacteria group bacterium]
MWSVISLNWTTQPVTPEQLLVLRKIAARILLDESNPVANFSHRLCEGHVTRGKVAVVGIFRGYTFKADLGLVQGERWTVDFMLPRGTEHLPIPTDAKIISTSTLRDGSFESVEVDVSQVGPFGGLQDGATHSGSSASH